MTNLQIKEKIDANNDIIREILNPTQFTLNNTVRELLEENAELQKQCTHNFIDGYCEYCYLEEPTNE
jgi:hypothetical protein